MKIITHPGNAHFDDWAACSLLIAANRKDLISEGRFEVIERREPTEKEIWDTNTWVVDIGKKLDFKYRCFDHHQDSNIPPAFMLVLEFLELGSRAREYLSWAKSKAMIDLIGIEASAKKFSLSVSTMKALNSPIEKYVLRQFATYNSINIERDAQLMGDWGEDVLAYLMVAPQYEADLKKGLKLHELKDGIFIGMGNIIQTTGLARWKHSLNGTVVSAIALPDNRGQGWSVRTWGNLLDFRKIISEVGVHYVTPDGGIMKTDSMEEKALVELIRRAL